MDAVFFDFDGVIAQSLEVKKTAFAALFAPLGPKIQEAAVRFHVEHGGMPRHTKMRHCLEQLAGRPASDALVDKLVHRFAELVFEGVVDAPLLPHVEATLQALCKAGCPTFLVSGTPEEEMRQIAESKELAHYFQGIFGAPRPKNRILRELLKQTGFRPAHCLFVGDALADMQAAQEHNLIFLGIVPSEERNIFPEEVITAPDPWYRRWPILLGPEFAL